MESPPPMMTACDDFGESGVGLHGLRLVVVMRRLQPEIKAS